MSTASKVAGRPRPDPAIARINELFVRLLMLAVVALPGARAQCLDNATMISLSQAWLPNANMTNWNTADSPVRPPKS